MKNKNRKRVFNQYRDDFFNGLYSDFSDRKFSKKIIREALYEDDGAYLF